MEISLDVSRWDFQFPNDVIEAHGKCQTSDDSTAMCKGYNFNEKFLIFHSAEWLPWTHNPTKTFNNCRSQPRINAKLKQSNNIKELYLFRWLCSVNTRLVLMFVRITASLNHELHKDEPKAFGHRNGKEVGSVTTLQGKIISPPILVVP